MAQVLSRIPHRTNLPFQLGRHLEHDERSRGYAFSAPTPAPKSVMWPISSQPLDQGDKGACTGYATATCFNTGPFAQRRHMFTSGVLSNMDGNMFYSLATHNDEFEEEWPPDDVGSSGLGAAKGAKVAGWIERYEHTFTFDEFCVALATQPVIVGTYWTNNMFDTDRNGFVTPDVIINANIAGGHAYCAYGIHFEERWIQFSNTWGKKWGNKGRFKMTFNAFQPLLAADGDCTVLCV